MGKVNDLAPARGKWDRIADVLGILSAFGIAFGGLFMVRHMLAEEEKALLQGGGMIAFADREWEENGWVEVVEKTSEVNLTLEELGRIVGKLAEEDAQAYPHEPLQGQLSMAEAIGCGRGWLEEFLVPRLGAQEYLTSEYRASCYLMSFQGDGVEEEEALGYWMVALSGENVEAVLLLSAVSGQVLDASIGCFFPVDSVGKEELSALLEDYAESFGVEGRYVIVSSDELTEAGDVLMFRNIGDSDIFATIKTGTFSVSPSASLAGSREVFQLRLYLCRNIL